MSTTSASASAERAAGPCHCSQAHHEEDETRPADARLPPHDRLVKESFASADYIEGRTAFMEKAARSSRDGRMQVSQ